MDDISASLRRVGRVHAGREPAGEYTGEIGDEPLGRVEPNDADSMVHLQTKLIATKCSSLK